MLYRSATTFDKTVAVATQSGAGLLTTRDPEPSISLDSWRISSRLLSSKRLKNGNGLFQDY
jgi:hypothetical protein